MKEGWRSEVMVGRSGINVCPCLELASSLRLYLPLFQAHATAYSSECLDICEASSLSLKSYLIKRYAFISTACLVYMSYASSSS